MRFIGKQICKRFFIFFLIFSWIFSGWPQIFNFPPEIKVIQAVDGSGTNSVVPTTATSASTGNTFTFTFTAAEAMNSGELRIKVPNSQSWSSPQGTAGTAGYSTVTASGNGMVANIFDSEDAGWIEDDTDACNVAVDGDLGLEPDGTVKYEGLGSILCNNTGSTGPDATDSFGFHFPARDLSSYTSLTFWVYSDVARNASVIQAALDDNFSCASPLGEVNIPALTAGTWTQVTWDISGVTRTAVKTFCINDASGSAGLDGAKIYIDDVQLNGVQLTDADYFHDEDDLDACNIAVDGDLGIGFSNSTIKEGLGSLVCDNTASALPDAGDSFGIDFPAQDWSSYTKMGFWIYTTVATDSTNYIQAALDDNFSCASPLAESNLNALSASTWTYVTVDISAVSRTAVKTLCFNAVGTGMDSRVIYIDEILIGPGVPTFPVNGSDTDISARILTLANSETMTITYGSGGGSSGVTAPSVIGDYTFTTRNKISVSGALSNIASHPVITVSSAGAAQSLTFSLGANSVAFGTLSASAVTTGSHTIIVGTNAANGVAVTYSGATLTSGGNTITAMSTAAASSVGTEQFGINAKDNATPNVGLECSGTPTIAAAATGYATADNFKFVSGETIVSSSGSINDTTCTISYIANITTATEAGSYSATLTYVATGNF